MESDFRSRGHAESSNARGCGRMLNSATALPGNTLRRTFLGILTRLATSLELLRALWGGPYWWLVPVLCILLPAAVVFVFLQAVPVVAPFVYTVF